MRRPNLAADEPIRDNHLVLSRVARSAYRIYGSGMIRTLPRASSFNLAACVVGLLTVAAPAHAFDDLFVRPAATLVDECRNGFLEWRIAEWRRRDRAPPLESLSVEDIMRDIDPPVLRALAERGCSNTYRYNLLACTQVDWPEDIDTTPKPPGASRIVPIGVTAETVPEMTAVIRDCLAALDDAGLSPAGGR